VGQRLLLESVMCRLFSCRLCLGAAVVLDVLYSTLGRNAGARVVYGEESREWNY